MRILPFLSRVALLCNLFFVVCLVLRVNHFTSSKDLEGFFIITGWIIAPLVTLLVNVWAVVLMAVRKPIPVPRWQSILNALFLLLQLIFIFLK